LLSSPTATNTYTNNEVSISGATDGTNQAYAGTYHNNSFNTVAKSSERSSYMSHEMNESANATFSSFGAGSVSVAWDASGTAYETPRFAAGDTLTESSSNAILSRGAALSGGGWIQ